ncbi:MAG: tetratricopeptide repeat protein [Caldilineaceae bacterium]
MTDKHPTPHDDQFFRDALNAAARLLSANRPGEAMPILERLLERYPNDADVIMNMGGALILQRRWKQAVRVLENGVKRHPDNASMWSNLAAAHLGTLEIAGPKQQQRAIKAYERALQINPQTPNVHYHLGLIYKERGDLLHALAHFEQARDVNPADKDAVHWIGRIEHILANVQKQQPDADTRSEDDA